MLLKKIVALLIGASSIITSCVSKNTKELKTVDRVLTDTSAVFDKKKILVLDNFSKKSISIDCDFISDVPHGFVVSKIIEKGLPNADVYKTNIPLGKQFYMQNTVPNKFVPKDTYYDAINISLGVNMPFDLFSKQTGINVNKENIAEKLPEVKKYLHNNKDKSLYNATEDSVKIGSVINFISDLDSLSAKGSKIYISAGNEGDKSFNLLSLVDNSITVGALNNTGEKAFYSADNSLVKRWENGVIKINKTDSGYNFTGGKGTDIGFDYTTSYIKLPGFNLLGTSNSAPRALVKDLIKL